MTLGWKIKVASLFLRNTIIRNSKIVLAASERALREEAVAYVRAANIRGEGAEIDADVLSCTILEDDADDYVRAILSESSDLKELEDEAVLLSWSTREWVKLKISRLLGWEKGESSVGGYPGW